MNPEKEPEYIIDDPQSQQKTDASAASGSDSDGQVYQDQCFTYQMAKPQEANKKTGIVAKYDSNFEYLVVVPGLNLRGMCQSPGCRACNKTTWIRLGYGTFNMNKVLLSSFCPCCNNKIKYKTIKCFGYRRAKIIVKGTILHQDEETEDFTQQFQERKGNLDYFKDIDGTVVTWAYLQVTATKI